MYIFARFVIPPIIGLYIRRIVGLENLRNPPYILAANHASFMDDIFVPHLVPRFTRARFCVFVNSRFYKNYFLRKFLYHYNCVPVDVSKNVSDKKKRKKTNDKAFSEALRTLKTGNIFVIFPEGTRSEDGKLRKAKTGMAKIALQARVPVIPVGVKGSFEIMPRGAKFPRFKKADIIIGKPLHFDKYYVKDKDYKVLEKISGTVMKEIGKLIDQKYRF